MSYRLLNSKNKIYVREDSEQLFCKAENLIFDFDGVLAQTNQSYRQTIRNVVDYYFLEILGLEGEKGKLVTLLDIQKFKDTGRFNNDWNLSYALVTYYVKLILRKLEHENLLQTFVNKFGSIKFSDLERFIQSLKQVGFFLADYGISADSLAQLKDDSIVGLDLFLAKCNLDKQKPIETSLVGVDPEVVEEKEHLVKLLIPFDLEKPDLLKRLFEEFYLGKDIYTKIYDEPSFFKFDSSCIDIEEFIPSQQTLDKLKQQFGKFGIYSGRPRPQGLYVLEKYGYMKYFEESEFVFLGDLLKSEEEMSKLGKPSPELFIELLQKSGKKDAKVVYVGDGISDVLLIENAKSKGFEGLLFLGVVSSSEDSNKLFTEYSKHGADAVVTDVNDIPYLFTCLRGN
ncbi:MAG: HAD family hydrolase [Candidatus Bathyarchaeota archaeon]|jgi:phosphoglycolate phosphatase-like HAD superfamily hydrolase